MKTITTITLLAICLYSCSNNEINPELLQPNVRRAKEFLDFMKKNEKFHALELVRDYNHYAPTPGWEDEFDKMYDEVYPIISSHKLKPVSKWNTMADEIDGEADYKVVFDGVFIPFDETAIKDDDPAYFYIGFEKEFGPGIEEFLILTKKKLRETGNLVSLMPFRESSIRNCIHTNNDR